MVLHCSCHLWARTQEGESGWSGPRDHRPLTCLPSPHEACEKLKPRLSHAAVLNLHLQWPPLVLVVLYGPNFFPPPSPLCTVISEAFALLLDLTPGSAGFLGSFPCSLGASRVGGEEGTERTRNISQTPREQHMTLQTLESKFLMHPSMPTPSPGLLITKTTNRTHSSCPPESEPA